MEPRSRTSGGSANGNNATLRNDQADTGRDIEAERLLSTMGEPNSNEMDTISPRIRHEKSKYMYNKAPAQHCSPCGLARICGVIMVAVVIALIGLSYLPMVYMYSDGSVKGMIILVIFHILAGLLLTSYLQVVLTDPGTVPKEWDAKVRAMSRSPYPMCKRSKMYKPPRSHFDSITRRLVLNMDHYCPWTNNCIGYFNRKFFILFVGYTCLTCAFCFFCLLPSISAIHLARHPRYLIGPPQTGLRGGNNHTATDTTGVGNEHPMFAVMSMMAAIFDAVFAITLLCFTVAHLMMACKNQTTIESGSSAEFFNVGMQRNLEQVFGTNKRIWLLPIYGDGPAGDGVHWPTFDGQWVGDLDVQLEEVRTPSAIEMQ